MDSSGTVLVTVSVQHGAGTSGWHRTSSGISFQLDFVCLLGHPVEDGIGEDGAVEEVMPFCKGALPGNNGGFFTDAGIEQFEQIFLGPLIQRRDRQIIEDQEIDFGEFVLSVWN